MKINNLSKASCSLFTMLVPLGCAGDKTPKVSKTAKETCQEQLDEMAMKSNFTGVHSNNDPAGKVADYEGNVLAIQEDNFHLYETKTTCSLELVEWSRELEIVTRTKEYPLIPMKKLRIGR